LDAFAQPSRTISTAVPAAATPEVHSEGCSLQRSMVTTVSVMSQRYRE
jgi:hypothetical protein